jgi:hypothetical protein
MAIYTGPDGKEYDCEQLPEGQVFPSGTAARKGEWIIREVVGYAPILVGAGRVCPAEDFKLFRQKYPKPVDGERKDPAPPTESRCA